MFNGTLKHAVESVAPQVAVQKMKLMLIRILAGHHQNVNKLLFIGSFDKREPRPMQIGKAAAYNIPYLGTRMAIVLML